MPILGDTSNSHDDTPVAQHQIHNTSDEVQHLSHNAPQGTQHQSHNEHNES